MKKLLFVLIVSGLVFGCNSENNQESDKEDEIKVKNEKEVSFDEDYITFLDGGSVKKEDFIKQCTGETYERDFCYCLLDQLTQNFTLKEYKSIPIRQMSYYLDNDNKDKWFKMITSCMDSTSFTGENYIEVDEFRMTLFSNELKKNYKIAISENGSIEEYNEFVDMFYYDKFIECMVSKVFEEFSIKEMSELIENGSHIMETVEFREIQRSCMDLHVKL